MSFTEKKTLSHSYLRLLSQQTLRPLERRITLGVGREDQELFSLLAVETMNKFPGLDITVCPLENNPAQASEIIHELCFHDVGEELLLPLSSVEEGYSLEEIEEQLEVKVTLFPLEPKEMLEALIASDSWYL